MRERDFIREAKRVPPISVRHINKLKKDELARQASFARRDALIRIMYANPANELEQIQLEKARVELAQEKAELEATKAVASQANKDALARMAASGIQSRRDSREKIEAMASNGLGRLKKL